MKNKAGIIQNFISVLLRAGGRSTIAGKGILCLLVAALAVTGSGEKSVPLQRSEAVCSDYAEATLETPSVSQPVDMWTEHVSESRPSAVVNLVRAVRTGFSGRSGFLFLLYSMTFLSIFSKCLSRVLVLHDGRYVYRRYFTISYMQDMDGRKRLPLILWSKTEYRIKNERIRAYEYQFRSLDYHHHRGSFRNYFQCIHHTFPLWNTRLQGLPEM